MTANERYQVSSSVFYRKYEDYVFLRNVDTRYEYTYNEIVFDILNILQEPKTINELLEELGAIYTIQNPEEFKKEINDFLEKLVKDMNVISLTDKNNESSSKVESKSKSVYTDLINIHNQRRQYWTTIFEITYRCTERCRHCYLDDPDEAKKNDEMTLDDYKRVIDEISDMGCMNALVTGGEPTLHPDFLDICRYIVSKRILLDVFTNALSISDSLFDSLTEMKLNSISFSLYGGSPEFHDYITQVPGSFQKTLLNILKFKATGVDIYIKSLLFRDHFDEWLKLDKLMRQLNLRLQTGTFLMSTHSREDRVFLMGSDEDYRAFLRLQNQRDIQANVEQVRPKRDLNSFICTAGRSSLSIAPNGDVHPCGSVPLVLGNIKHDSIREIWEHSEKLQEFYKYKYLDLDPECRDCKLSDYCSICLGEAYNPKDGKLSKCSYTCRHAKIRYEETKFMEKGCGFCPHDN